MKGRDLLTTFDPAGNGGQSSGRRWNSLGTAALWVITLSLLGVAALTLLFQALMGQGGLALPRQQKAIGQADNAPGIPRWPFAVLDPLSAKAGFMQASHPQAPLSSVWCVDDNGGSTGGAPCTNSTAFTSIQTAINGASAGDEIRIAAGTYTGSGTTVVTIDRALTITGG